MAVSEQPAAEAKQSDWERLRAGMARGFAWARSHPLLAPLVGLIVVGLLFLVLYALFPSAAPDWTGFGVRLNPQYVAAELLPPRGLWDWLQLLIVPGFIAGAAAWLGHLQQKRELREVQTDRELAKAARENAEGIARDRQEQQILENYYDRMGELLLNHDLSQQAENEAARSIARARTFTVLENLNGRRRGLVLRFLYESKLIATPEPVIDLRRANLGEVELIEASLRGAHLAGADLRNAELARADLSRANLCQANLGKAKMMATRLDKVVAREVVLTRAKMRGARFVDGDFTKAYLVETSLGDADFDRTSLAGANLKRAMLRGARLHRALLHSPTSAEDDGEEVLAAHIEEAEFNAGTTWPDGFDPVAEGAILAEQAGNG